MTEAPEGSGGYDFPKIIQELREFGANLGADALIYTVVAIGVFVGLISGTSAPWTVGAGITILVLWLGNKAVNLRTRINQADARLEELKVTQGRALLAKHKRRRPAKMTSQSMDRSKQ